MAAYDFGYTWPWTYGHLVLAVPALLAAWFGRKRIPRWITAVLALIGLWAFAGFLIVQFVFGFNRPMAMPTPNFLASNRGRVIDLGAGSGRATIMVGLARPGVQLVGLDNFSADYIRDNGETLFMRNCRAAGIEQRTSVLRADMRSIPAKDGEFDGAVSTYAIDHLDRRGIGESLREVSRVLKPGGEFLLAVVHGDVWLKVAYGPMLMHARKIPSNWWPDRLKEAGLTVVEQGATPGSLHFLCRKQ